MYIKNAHTNRNQIALNTLKLTYSYLVRLSKRLFNNEYNGLKNCFTHTHLDNVNLISPLMILNAKYINHISLRHVTKLSRIIQPPFSLVISTEKLFY